MYKPAADALPPQQGINLYFVIQKYSFASIGIDITSLDRTVFNRFLAWIPMMTLFLFCFPMVIYASRYIEDLDLVTDALSPFWQAILSIMKLLYFFYNKTKIIQLVRKVWMWNLEARNEELEIIAEENRTGFIFCMCLYCCGLITGFFALSSPFLIAWFYHHKGYGYWDSLVTPLKAAYFIDPKSYFGYIFAYVWNMSCAYFIINGTLSTDSLFSWLMHNVAAHFRILNLRFKTAAESVRCSTDEKELQKLLIARVKHHLQVIDLAQNLNEVYMVTVFLKFAISFLQIACLAFQLSRDNEYSAQIFHFFFLFSACVQLMLYCYGGQRIQNESTSVADTIYDYFKWHNLSIDSKKLLLLSMLRAQKPCNLTGVFFVADLSLLLWVFKTAGSCITVLVAMEEK